MSISPQPPSHREDRGPANTQRVLSGRYELGELIGRGGMADVFRGVDTRLGRTVAVKLLRPDLARDPQFQARFKREAQAVAALNHSSIVAIFDTGDHAVPGDHEDTVRVPYIVMEFVSGRTIRDLIKAHEVSIDQAIGFTLGVLSALDYSHKAGIVHRDIKPANVMFCPDSNSVKVMDFGIARAMADSAATMTQTQAVVGTAQYLSPEQARGETVDARSDLYSAGCLLYEMLVYGPFHWRQSRLRRLPARSRNSRACQQPESRRLRGPGQRTDEGAAKEPCGPVPGCRGVPPRPAGRAERSRSRSALC
ncbi:protein kinase domain-containing protein [Pseudarthrobacter sp. So.54]